MMDTIDALLAFGECESADDILRDAGYSGGHSMSAARSPCCSTTSRTVASSSRGNGWTGIAVTVPLPTACRKFVAAFDRKPCPYQDIDTTPPEEWQP